MKSSTSNDESKNNQVVLHITDDNDNISKEKFVAAGAGLQFIFGLGAMSGPFLCSLFMDFVGPNGFFVFLFFFTQLLDFLEFIE